MTAEHDDERPLLEDGAMASTGGLWLTSASERARFLRELRLARNPNMVTPGNSGSQLATHGHKQLQFKASWMSLSVLFCPTAPVAADSQGLSRLKQATFFTR